MTARVGIRREDKNRWERRAPLTPEAVRRLVDAGIAVTVQPSDLRVFPDDEYRLAGATVAEDLSGCGVVVAVKEIPAELISGPGAFICFSHTIKGQAHNMPLLQHVLDTGATLIDYERIVDSDGGRIIHFGRFAGLAGALDGLWALGRRWQELGLHSPLAQLRPAWTYHDLDAALAEVTAVGDAIAQAGVPLPAGPLVVGVVGYGNVAGGANEVLDCLAVRDIAPDDLSEVFLAKAAINLVYRVRFREEDTVQAREGAAFALPDYRRHPHRYQSRFGQYLPHLSLLVNAIYWDERSPRLVSRDELMGLAGADATRLQVIADLSCDIDGGVAATTKATTPDSPVYVFDPATGTTTDGVAGAGVVVLAVDHLPCELPRDASASFSAALEPWLPAIAAVDFSRPLAELALPPQWRSAVIAHQGRLAPDYAHLTDALASAALMRLIREGRRPASRTGADGPMTGPSVHSACRHPPPP